MNEDIQIKQGERLADNKSPLQFDKERAESFVAAKLESGSAMAPFYKKKEFYWTVTTLALAACFVAAVLIVPWQETPAQIHENVSIHASVDVMDSTSVAQVDSVIIAE